ncbi:MAG: DNA polymerase/3'-5' exonuclease PolX [Patescibacteria group bacterium]
MGNMTNQEIAKIFYEISEYLEMQNEPFKPRAYRRAAEAIGGLQESLADIYEREGLKGLEDVPGVGVSIAEKIEELLETGKLKYYQRLKEKMPVDLAELSAVEGLGPNNIKILYKKLGIKNIKQLEQAAKQGKIRRLEGFGEKKERNILRGIEFLKKSGGRFLLSVALAQAREIEGRLQRIKGIKKAVVAGSVRRRKETIGDLDFLVATTDKQATDKVIDFFVSMPEVAVVFAKGDTKAAVKLKNGLDADLRVVPEKSYGAALNYFTGSKDHNIALRKIAIKKGYKLNEYGLFRGQKWVAGKNEEEIYKKLGLEYIESEMREMTGEIGVKLPQLIDYRDLRGDLQIQTDWSDGNNSIEEMAKAAVKAGLEYILITDHTKRLAMANGLDEKRILKQMKEIDQVNERLKKQKIKIKVLKGSECDILKDGAMDLSDKVLSKLDIVGGAVHSHFNLSKKEQTERLKKAMANPHVDIIFHPTGRLINKRPAYDLDMEEIIKTAKRTKTVLEIDAFPDRLDLKDEYIHQCVDAGVRMSISSDAHSADHFSVLEYGIAQARRGWATKKDIINVWSLTKMLKMTKSGRE